jgi:phthalate 4,5-dioxygenase oxygenase subunit
MLSAQENQAVTRVVGGAPMGELMARFWTPVIRTAELTADGDPEPVVLFGRRLVAFRDSAGQVGVLNEHCPHRGASLTLARNENCALQCLYHGWRIAADGTVLDTPTEREDSTFKSRVGANAYPVWEAGGLVWAYLGPIEEEPPKPEFDFTGLPDDQLMIIKGVEYCNWLQCLEGAVDSAHLTWLHADITRPDWKGDRSGPDAGGELLSKLTPAPPVLEAETTHYGFRYGAIRPAEDDRRYVRTTQFVMPFHSNFPGTAGHWAHHQMFVPIDDENTLFFYIQYRTDGVSITGPERAAMFEFAGVEVDRTDDAGRMTERVMPTRENRWLQDRGAMRSGESFTGLRGINNEDFVVQESMGPIYDRTQEHLGASDVAVIRLRRVLLAALASAAHGDRPAGLAEPVPYPELRGREGLIASDESWQSVATGPAPAPR